MIMADKYPRTMGEEMSLLAGFGAMIDIAILIGIIVEAVKFISDRRAR